MSIGVLTWVIPHIHPHFPRLQDKEEAFFVVGLPGLLSFVLVSFLLVENNPRGTATELKANQSGKHLLIKKMR